MKKISIIDLINYYNQHRPEAPKVTSLSTNLASAKEIKFSSSSGKYLLSCPTIEARIKSIDEIYQAKRRPYRIILFTTIEDETGSITLSISKNSRSDLDLLIKEFDENNMVSITIQDSYIKPSSNGQISLNLFRGKCIINKELVQ